LPQGLAEQELLLFLKHHSLDLPAAKADLALN
jgi:hypothetical protein